MWLQVSFLKTWLQVQPNFFFKRRTYSCIFKRWLQVTYSFVLKKKKKSAIELQDLYSQCISQVLNVAIENTAIDQMDLWSCFQELQLRFKNTAVGRVFFVMFTSQYQYIELPNEFWQTDLSHDKKNRRNTQETIPLKAISIDLYIGGERTVENL